MSDTLPNIDIPVNEWVDLYSLSSVFTGKEVALRNVGVCDIYVTVKESQPPVDYDSYTIIQRKNGVAFNVNAGSVGLWAFCNSSGGKLNVEELVSTNSQLTSYNELTVANLTPVAQMTANYGIPAKAFTLAVLGASTSAGNSLFTVNSGATPSAIATILTKRQMLYRSGQGSVVRLSALFDTPQDGSQQFAGIVTATDVLAFGYQDLEYGVVHGRGGVVEVQHLQITTPATGAEDATITVDGVAFTVPITAGTVAHNAFEIAQSLESQSPAYDFTANGDTVVAIAVLAQIAGTFAFTGATAIATWTQISIGQSTVDTFIPQSQWNGTKLETLNPQNGNVYQITYQYGFGHIHFSIENPETGDMTIAHAIEYANNNVLPPIANPSVRAGWVVRNITNTTPLDVKGASVGMFNEGDIVITNLPRGDSFTQPAVDTTQTNIITFRSRVEFGGKRNRAEVFMKSVSATTDSTKGAVLEVRINADIAGEPIYEYLDVDFSILEKTNDKLAVTGGTLVGVIPISTAGSIIDLEKLGLSLIPGDTITVSMAIIGAVASEMTASLIGVEDL